ncbi:hypothetical protein PMI15_04660 [Polaromonas sp. CF318]|uniref:hypothetical protein n=1 Tax=Polaromonas sp. CF318 TaxID=1144318 RepID=UPI0002713DAF|nr:hypothetical protein [Polaromonas sp. CF318]EJL77338.1 hypothetical protein PMI15_04660 [Polaromonas sp. CF318]
MTKTIIFSAPQGWGKTRNKAKLRAEFGCKQVIDGWSLDDPIQKNGLHLTNVPPGQFRNNKPELYTLVSRGWPS